MQEPPPLRGSIPKVADSRIDSYLKEIAVKEHFIGGVLVMRDGRLLHASGYGLASSRRWNDVNTEFHVGSITKEFTAAAIMQLVEQGVLGLDSPINIYLPSNYRSDKWNSVTVHHLLSHTSGIPNYAVVRGYYRVKDGFCPPETIDGMVKEAMGKDLEFDPGSKYSYSDLGYTLLGIIIENQTHVSYGEYIKTRVLDPMGMTSSRIHVVGHAHTEYEAEGFRWDTQRREHVPDDVVSLPSTAPDGGLITTLGDFAKWARIFGDGEQSILSQRSIQRMSNPQAHIGNGGPLDSMGYGLYVGDRLIGHGGRVVGFSSQFVYDRQTRTLIAVFSNDVDGNPQQVVFGLLTMLLAPGGSKH